MAPLPALTDTQLRFLQGGIFFYCCAQGAGTQNEFLAEFYQLWLNKWPESDPALVLRIKVRRNATIIFISVDPANGE